MAMAIQAASEKLLTYAQYMAEGEVNQRYEILDGVRIVTNPTRRHQDIAGNLYERFRQCQRTGKHGRTFQPPCDVLITAAPLRVRQPDVLFMSNERLTQNPPDDDPAPLNPAPELIVEVRSPSDTVKVMTDKIADYCKVNVLECWIVDLNLQTVEVLRLTSEGAQTFATYGIDETVVSSTFPDISISVTDVFAN